MSQHYPFVLTPLPYPFDALSPYIDSRTVAIHHEHHQSSYVRNLNQALAKCPQYHRWTLEQLARDYTRLPKKIQTTVRNNAGGLYTHELYFNGMTGSPLYPTPIGRLGKAIDHYFGSFENFQRVMSKSATSQFASGWAWLVADKYDRLSVLSTPNHDTPLPQGLKPIVVVDVWEHAYYLGYTYQRSAYVDAWWNLVDWEVAEARYTD